MNENKIILFTDGSYYKKTPNIGGAGVYSQYIQSIEPTINAIELFTISKSYHKKPITSQRMELYACIDGIRFLTKNHDISKNEIQIISDSKYVIDSMTKWVYTWKKYNWKRDAKQTKEICNLDLIKKLHKLTENYNVKYSHQYSHKKEPVNKNSIEWFTWNGNDQADLLAKNAIHKKI